MDPGQKKDIRGNTGEIQITFVLQLIVSSQCKFLSFDHCAAVMLDVNMKGNWVKDIWKICTIFATLGSLKFFPNERIFKNERAMPFVNII